MASAATAASASVGRWNFALSLVLLVLCQQRCLCVDQVPVLLWSTQSSLWSSEPPPHVGHIVSESQLEQQFLKPVPRSQLLLLFIQDKLSVDDFTRFGAFAKRNENAFSSVQTALRSSPSSLVLPAVDWWAANELASKLSQRTAGAVTEVKDFPVPLASLTRDSPGLTVVHLPATASASEEARGRALAKNDEIIGQVMKLLEEGGQSFTAVYTASRPSKVPTGNDWGRDELAADWHVNRQLLQAATKAPPAPAGSHAPLVVQNGTQPCIAFWARRLLVGFGSSAAATYDLTNATFVSGLVNSNASVCDTDNSTLVLSYSNLRISNLPVTNLNIEIRLSQRHYPVSNRNWMTVEQLIVEAVNETAGGDAISWNATEQYAVRWASNPSEYSYSCGAVDSEPRHSGMVLMGSFGPDASPAERQRQIHFSIEGFQIQGSAAMRNGTAFAYASDCASFFTPAIWMGLVSGFVLLLVLTYALHMLSSIKTMDRFDDPKAPGLSIPQTD
ncbi:V-type proton ATPase subunit S1-like [Lampetra fluviatilis]